MDLVSTMKTLLLTLREEGFDHLLLYVQSICPQHGAEIPDLDALYKSATAIDFQREELNSRFSDGAVELLVLSSALDPKDNFKSFKAEEIYRLGEIFYPEDFTKQESLVETSKLHHYNLIDRLIRLFLTLLVSTATTEHSFSAMKLVKTALRNKMEDEFLQNSMMLYIERDLVEDID
ncbi:uncharacterized protein LOC141703530 [Apium graveolens]|uniref:uncharacterized protein LOC141703530 n=1 Tax=Apium graveolens TaxID=4045 RepID=UPI003D7B27F3